MKITFPLKGNTIRILNGKTFPVLQMLYNATEFEQPPIQSVRILEHDTVIAMLREGDQKNQVIEGCKTTQNINQY
jgi:SPX domain protein involved in polyphosphate accumulation